MPPRFHAPDLDPSASFVTLPSEEARHLTRVLRLRAGDEVSVFDGKGVECRAVVDAAVRDTATLRLVEVLAPVAAPTVGILLVQAVLKGNSMDDAVRDATMMGVVALAPIVTDHTDVRASVVSRPETVERWRRVALASAKQSRRATLPEIRPVQTFTQWIASRPKDLTLIFVEPSARCECRPLKAMGEPVPTSAVVMVGPEGGWSAEEIAKALGAGCVPVSLGPLTLRAEAMALASLSALSAIWQG